MSVSRLHLVTPRARRGALEDAAARVGLAVDLGLLAPGERLPDEAELAGAFGVAPITMRRALRRLCDEGVLVRRRGRVGGTFVSSEPPNLSALVEYRAKRAEISREVWDLLDYRQVLETGLFHRAAARAVADDIVRLSAMVEGMDAAKDWPGFRALDPRFHLTVASIAGPQRAVDELADVLGRLGQLYFPHPIEYLREVNREHRAMVEAFAGGDGAAAVRVLETHLVTLRADLLVDRSTSS
jgi:GntR family transcriptional repressor for pyruvate dehydrogenase complex